MPRPVAYWMIAGVLAACLSGCGKYVSVENAPEPPRLEVRDALRVPEIRKSLISNLGDGKSDLDQLLPSGESIVSGYRAATGEHAGFARIGRRSSELYSEWQEFRSLKKNSEPLPRVTRGGVRLGSIPASEQLVHYDAQALAILNRYSADHANAYTHVRYFEVRLASASEGERPSLQQKLESAKADLIAVDSARDLEVKAHLQALEKEQEQAVASSEIGPVEPAAGRAIARNSSDSTEPAAASTSSWIPVNSKSAVSMNAVDVTRTRAFSDIVHDVQRTTDDAIRVSRTSYGGSR